MEERLQLQGEFCKTNGAQELWHICCLDDKSLQLQQAVRSSHANPGILIANELQGGQRKQAHCKIF